MQQIDFSQGSIRRRILAVATPMLIAQLLNLLYNIVDRIYIGKIPGEGTLALASIGLCFPLSLIHISEPTRLNSTSRMPSSA